MRGGRGERDPSEATRVERSAGGVVFRRSPRGVEILLGHQVDWNTRARTVRLPKGHIDPGEALEDAALREVREETGRRARIVEPLGESRYAYENLATGEVIGKHVVYFLMEDAGDASAHRDDEMDDVGWHALADAIEALTFENEREAVRAAAARIERVARGS